MYLEAILEDVQRLIPEFDVREVNLVIQNNLEEVKGFLEGGSRRGNLLSGDLEKLNGLYLLTKANYNKEVVNRDRK
jgi:hypothetical protein